MGAVLLNRATQTHYRYVIAGLVLLCYFSGGLNFAVVTPLFKLIIAEYGITHAIVSLLVSLVSLINASVGLPGGIIGGRWEARRILLFSWLLIGLLALSPLAPNFWVLLALRLAYGVGFGLQFPATGPLLMAWFQPNEIRVLSGLNIALFGLGVAISVTTVVPLADLVGWRSALGVFGGFALVGAIVWAVFARSAPGEAPRSSGISTREIWDTLRHKTLVLVILADVAVFSQYQAITSWLPAFYNEVRGMSLEQAGFVTGLLPLVGVAAVMAGGILDVKDSVSALLSDRSGTAGWAGRTGCRPDGKPRRYLRSSYHAWNWLLGLYTDSGDNTNGVAWDDATPVGGGLGGFGHIFRNRDGDLPDSSRRPEGPDRLFRAGLTDIRGPCLVAAAFGDIASQG